MFDIKPLCVGPGNGSGVPIPIDDAASNRVSLTDPAGGVSTYSYDSVNRLTGLTDFNSASFGFGYDALGRRTSLTRPNGVSTSYTYDTLSRLLGVLHNGGSLPGSAGYTYDAAGNRLTKTAVQAGNPNPVSVTSQYSYDSIYELTQAVVGGSLAEGYSYDAVGNRLTSAGPTSYNYNSSNELTSSSAALYAYDNNGNTTSKTTSLGTTSYAWDFENRLASVTLPGTGGAVRFKYDPFGRRIQKVSPSGTTIYAYDGDNVIEELGGGGNLLAHYTQGEQIDEPLAATGTGGTHFYHADGLGSITSSTDTTGNLANSYVYDSFGKLTASTGTIANPFQYTGREFDSETGLYYYRARYYDPGTGRFLSEDPIRSASGGFQLYAYVGNSSPNFRDPRGLVRVDPTFPTSCLPGLTQAMDIVRRAAKLIPECNCQFKQMGDGRSLLDLLNAPDITIRYDPVQQPPTPPETGVLAMYTNPDDVHDIWAEPYGCKMGRWTLASFLVHELTHIAQVPGEDQENAAKAAQAACGFRIIVMSPTIVVTGR